MITFETRKRKFFSSAASRRRSNVRVASVDAFNYDAAKELNDLLAPPSNHLEALSGERQGQYSIRINDQWRICFEWLGQDAYSVEIVDYH